MGFANFGSFGASSLEYRTSHKVPKHVRSSSLFFKIRQLPHHEDPMKTPGRGSLSKGSIRPVLGLHIYIYISGLYNHKDSIKALVIQTTRSTVCP